MYATHSNLVVTWGRGCCICPFCCCPHPEPDYHPLVLVHPVDLVERRLEDVEEYPSYGRADWQQECEPLVVALGDPCDLLGYEGGSNAAMGKMAPTKAKSTERWIRAAWREGRGAC
ncbi:hypothetical protein MLD38_017019 [Melastoma candidum]|uniref:Uncharacterized protein n=1 Tax=Melastoma candidum TaxID=119954 RepID=A0ACB9QTC3_9MYRT|nr:hypothetical protein MLD38_017019 [Melastoma candidum]